MLALLIFTALSGWRSCGVVITKFSRHVVTFRSSPTVVADTPVPTSASTRILAGKPPRAMSSAAMLLHLYRGIGSSLIARCRAASTYRHFHPPGSTPAPVGNSFNHLVGAGEQHG